MLQFGIFYDLVQTSGRGVNGVVGGSSGTFKWPVLFAYCILIHRLLKFLFNLGQKTISVQKKTLMKQKSGTTKITTPPPLPRQATSLIREEGSNYK